MKPGRFLWLLIGAVILTRLPLLLLGYGSDGDAWRVAWSASKLWNGGAYEPSRFPGFPVYEILSAPLVGLGGPVLANTGTLVVFIAAIVLFRMLLREWEVPSSTLLLVTFAFLPILWKNSAISMDYIWGLAGILAAFVLAARKRYLLAAAVLGVAAGTRITALAFLLPLAVLPDQATWRRTIIGMALVAAGTTVVCYLPVLLRPELMHDTAKYLSDVRSYTLLRRIALFLYRSVFAIGLLGALGVAVMAIPSWRTGLSAIRRNDRRVIASILGVAAMLVVFFLLSDEREYLIPALPFLLIILGILLRPAFLGIAAGLLLSYSVISLDVSTHEFDRQRFSLHLASGILITDIQNRLAQAKLRESLGKFPPGDSSILMTGLGPVLWFRNPGMVHTKELEEQFRDQDVARSALRPQTYFVYGLPPADCRRYLDAGYRIYYLEGTREYLESFLGYNLLKAGARPFRPLDF